MNKLQSLKTQSHVKRRNSHHHSPQCCLKPLVGILTHNTMTYWRDLVLQSLLVTYQQGSVCKLQDRGGMGRASSPISNQQVKHSKSLKLRRSYVNLSATEKQSEKTEKQSGQSVAAGQRGTGNLRCMLNWASVIGHWWVVYENSLPSNHSLYIVTSKKMFYKSIHALLLSDV